MANRVVSLLMRVSLSSGKRPYLKPVTSANGTVRPLWALYEGKPTHFASGVYYLRFKQGPKLVFERIGPHLDEALAQLARKRNHLEGVILGNQPAPVTKAKILDTSLETAIETYLAQVRVASSPHTAANYNFTLNHFRKFMVSREKLTIESIDFDDMTGYGQHMQREGWSERTQFNRLQGLHTFLKSKGRGTLYPRNCWPTYTEKEPEAYNREELAQLFASVSDEDRLAFQFFLFSGLRKAEVLNATWRSVNFVNKTYTVLENRGLGFRPKGRKERSVPIPDDLCDALWQRKQTSKSQLIFSNSEGGVEEHFLRRLKTAAFRAGLNCQECVDRSGHSCKDHPICYKWKLHSLRRSFATLSHQSGVSARDIQRRLGHSDLSTTERYLRASDNQSLAVRNQVNQTFVGLTPISKPKLVA